MGKLTKKDLNALEKVLDKVFSNIGMDIEFTRHFLDRVNDARNKKQIDIKELALLFRKEYIKWGKPIYKMGPDSEGVMKDMASDINIPFILKWNKEKKELEMIAKTIMRKKNFKTPDRQFPVESVNEDIQPHPDVIKAYKKTLAADNAAADYNHRGNKGRVTRAYNHLSKMIKKHHPDLSSQENINLRTKLQNTRLEQVNEGVNNPAMKPPRWKRAGSDGEIETKFPSGRRFKVEKQYDENIRHRGEWKVMEWDNRTKEWEWADTYSPKAYAKEMAMKLGQYKNGKKVADYSSSFKFESVERKKSRRTVERFKSFLERQYYDI